MPPTKKCNCIAERLKVVLPSIINDDQTGFISSRFIAENVRILYDIMHHAEKKKKKKKQKKKKKKKTGMLLLIDFEKAYDSVDWEFLYKALKFFNFGDSFIQWVNLFLH